MPSFRVLKCYDDPCGTYQIHQAKKAKGWQCKVCNAKQSLKRIYYESEDAADCRQVVQALNLRRQGGTVPTGGSAWQSASAVSTALRAALQEPAGLPLREDRTCSYQPADPTSSKWSTFVEVQSDSDEGPVDLAENRFTTVVPATATAKSRKTEHPAAAMSAGDEAMATKRRRTPASATQSTSGRGRRRGSDQGMKQMKMSAFFAKPSSQRETSADVAGVPSVSRTKSISPPAPPPQPPPSQRIVHPPRAPTLPNPTRFSTLSVRPSSAPMATVSAAKDVSLPGMTNEPPPLAPVTNGTALVPPTSLRANLLASLRRLNKGYVAPASRQPPTPPLAVANPLPVAKPNDDGVTSTTPSQGPEGISGAIRPAASSKWAAYQASDDESDEE
ncbi:hypothetical protein IWQ60_007199 [Tieghemiomyces parasiticus]|uniref:MRN complex-interacting protein N-terminal domain-containing protein n=1 Tax=Tieghemiomyces parasiticus TaxID=78921 RepID=A0A9W8A4V4_9FUNG|nr:hypothetical protein IWQ60_007199 [Tieghemiomyces parasiticus]